MEGAVRRVPADRRRGHQPDDQRPRGVHARTTSSSWARARSAGSSSRPGSAPTGSPARAGSAARWPRWIVDGEPELDLWKMDIRRFGAQYRSPGLHAGPDVRGLRHLLRHPLPERGAPGGPAAAPLAGVRAAGRAGRVVRREVGLGAAELVRGNEDGPASHARLRRSGRAAGPASTGRPAIGAEALATRRAAGPVRRDRASPRSRSPGRARCGFLQRPVRQRHRPARRRDRLHPDAQPARRHRVRLHGHPARRATGS